MCEQVAQERCHHLTLAIGCPLGCQACSVPQPRQSSPGDSGDRPPRLKALCSSTEEEPEKEASARDFLAPAAALFLGTQTPRHRRRHPASGAVGLCTSARGAARLAAACLAGWQSPGRAEAGPALGGSSRTLTVWALALCWGQAPGHHVLPRDLGPVPSPWASVCTSEKEDGDLSLSEVPSCWDALTHCSPPACQRD